MRELELKNKILIYGVMFGICATCIIPLIAVISISFSDDLMIMKEGYDIFPKGFNFEAYKYVFKDVKTIIRSYGISIYTTFVGCVVGLFLNALMAYVLSRKDYKYRKQLTWYFTIPMLLNGGMVSSYILIVRYLDLKNSLWAVILPGLVVPWFVILLRTFFSEIPTSLIEAATLEGASELKIFTHIIIPLSKPALATVGMFLVLRFWNEWFRPMMYIEKSELYNLQYRLYLIMRNTQEMLKNATGLEISRADLPTESMRMAMCVIAAGPMLAIFPFFQKYFVKGLTVGGVKG